MQTSNNQSAHPGDTIQTGIFTFPPFIFLASMIGGLILHMILPLRPFRRRKPGIALSVPLLASGIGLTVWAAKTMTDVGERPDFHDPTRSVVSDGPFAYSRNPIYTGAAIASAGGAFLFNSLWPLLTLPFGLLQLRYRVIAREEGYLEERFGDPYLEYKEQVRRWL